MKMHATICWLVLTAGTAVAANTVAIGDSLTAEYDTIPENSGFPTEATEYAKVTVPGWVSKSWVEILAQLRPGDFEFGARRKLSDPFPPPRLSGYARNWGIPGILASQYEDFVTSRAGENPFYFGARQPLENQLENEAERVVVWLGNNEFRARYGQISEGESPDNLIDNLMGDLRQVVEFVKDHAPQAQIAVANLPDLGASPDKQESQPDPAKRALVTAAVQQANARIAELVNDEGLALVNVYAVTEPLVAGEQTYFGAVPFDPGSDPDNEPRHLFTRDGLHPNTALQIRLARQVILTFNQRYGARVPQITDAEA
jgi:lysophospholipase L1-like esterase